MELGGREVIGLSEIADGPGLFAHPDPVDRQIPGQGIGRRRSGLDPALGVGADQAADENHAGEERNLANPDADQAVAEIGRQIAVPRPGNRFGAQGRRGTVIHSADAPPAFWGRSLSTAVDRAVS
ncbi:hypothetical protein D3C71_1498640 [compost metagenome]